MIQLLDTLVRESIQRIFPDGKIPDEENQLPDGSRYGAPDHEVLGGRVLIERKSLNAVDEGRLFAKATTDRDEAGARNLGAGNIQFGAANR